LVAGDFIGDGHLDLAVTDRVKMRNPNGGYTYSDGVSILEGDGHGGFKEEPDRLVVGPAATPQGPPQEGLSLVAAHLRATNGPLDLAVAVGDDNEVAVLLGNGDGTFHFQGTYATGTDPLAIVAADLNGDGILDLATADAGSNTVSVLAGLGNGRFAAPVAFTVGEHPHALVAADFTGDGRLDLATANEFPNTVSVLLAGVGLTFPQQETYAVGDGPVALVTADFNGDGLPDLATVNYSGNDGSVLLNQGNGSFVPPGAVVYPALRSTPLFGHVGNDTTTDAVVLDGAGDILFRPGSSAGAFGAPVVVNPGHPVSDVALVMSQGQTLIAAVSTLDNLVYLFDRQPGGTFAVQAQLAGGQLRLDGKGAVQAQLSTGQLPTRIVSADLGNGYDDLVTLNSGGADTLSIFLQGPDGSFTRQIDPSRGVFDYPAGVVGASDLSLAYDRGDKQPPDILVTGQVSGDVAVLRNQGDGTFAPAERFRAGTGLYGLTDSSGGPDVVSQAGTIGVVAGDFTNDGQLDLVAVNANGLTLMLGQGPGSFLNPRTIVTGGHPSMVQVGDFNGDGNLDLAVLEGDQVVVYSGDGKGDFTETFAASAGLDPTGLTVQDVTGPAGGGPDGNLDLVIGNAFGDLLIYPGKGDGKFQTFQREPKVSLDVHDNGTGNAEVLTADEQDNLVSVQQVQTGQGPVEEPADALLAPAAVKFADLNGDGIPDEIVANRGGNDVLVFLGTGNGHFSPTPETFFVGTSPVALAVADLTGNGIPDIVVVNEGSNDVSILLGKGKGAAWTLVNGPRLQTGLAPDAVTVRDITGIPLDTGAASAKPFAKALADVPAGAPDILVANSGSNTVSLLPNVGNGFFNDQLPQIPIDGQTPTSIIFGTFDGRPDLVTVNAGSNDLTFISDFLGVNQTMTTLGSGGTGPVAAVSGDIDGESFLIVANNEDGVLKGFEGTADGLKAIGAVDFANPTDVAYDPVTGTLYATQEGSLTAVPFLLTAFGIAIPSSFSADLGTPLGQPAVGVLVVSGPGFPAAVNLPLATLGADQVPGSTGLLAFNLPIRGAAQLDGGPGNADEGEPPGGPPGVPPGAGSENLLRSNIPGAGKKGPGWTLGPDSTKEPDDSNDEIFQQELFPDLEAAAAVERQGMPSLLGRALTACRLPGLATLDPLLGNCARDLLQLGSAAASTARVEAGNGTGGALSAGSAAGPDWVGPVNFMPAVAPPTVSSRWEGSGEQLVPRAEPTDLQTRVAVWLEARRLLDPLVALLVLSPAWWCLWRERPKSQRTDFYP